MTTEAPTTDAPTTTGPDLTAGRPYTVFTPSTYDESTPMPLVVLLHGFGATGAIQEAYFRLEPLAESKGFLYVHPDGTLNAINKQFWNATDACCNFYGSTVDDSKYLIDLVNEIKTRVNVDPKRVYFFGHSNGGFMSHRMACDHAGDIAAIVSLAGAMFDDPTTCKPAEPVSVLQIHGTMDDTIAYGGGTLVNTYPSANETIMDWVTLDECDPTPDVTKPDLDLDGNLAGAETHVQAWGNGCKAGGHAELWTMDGGGHIPAITDTFTETAIQFLLAHPKP
jgi:polyhydroxybutyrate depolymerase